MRTYNQIHFSQISDVLMQAAQGVAAVSGLKYIISDMVYTLGGMRVDIAVDKEPYYVAIRELGVEGGTKDYCLDRCQKLGYPIVIAKVEGDKVCDYNMTITFTHGWMDRDNNYMEQEFNSL